MLGPVACLLTIVFCINPLYADGLDYYFGFDPLPVVPYLSIAAALNKIPYMDYNASASSLHLCLLSYICLIRLFL